MVNPLRGVLLNGRFYNYVEGSFTESLGLKNSSNVTQNSKTFSCLGGTLPSFTITIALENTYHVKHGPSVIGESTNLGVSRKYDMEQYLTRQGASMPVTFVTPYGATYSVVPTGTVDFLPFSSTASADGYEFRTTLTLAASA